MKLDLDPDVVQNLLDLQANQLAAKDAELTRLRACLAELEVTVAQLLAQQALE